jgi:hypothetical protein
LARWGKRGGAREVGQGRCAQNGHAPQRVSRRDRKGTGAWERQKGNEGAKQ